MARPEGAPLCVGPCQDQSQALLAMGWVGKGHTPGGLESLGTSTPNPSPISLKASCFLSSPRPLNLLEGPSSPSLQTPILSSILGSNVLASRKPTLIHQASVPNLGSLGGCVDGAVSLS